MGDSLDPMFAHVDTVWDESRMNASWRGLRAQASAAPGRESPRQELRRWRLSWVAWCCAARTAPPSPTTVRISDRSKGAAERCSRTWRWETRWSPRSRTPRSMSRSPPRTRCGSAWCAARAGSGSRPRPSGPTRVVAGEVTIAVYASEFSVARYADAAEVWAHRGPVRVEWRGQAVALDEGEHQRFQSDAASGDAIGAAGDGGDDDQAVREPDGPHNRSARRDRGTWRKLASRGDHDAAYEALRAGARVRDRAADLLLAADVYRTTGHARDAVAPLRRVVSRHARDPRAPLAAFTLGRVLLDDLGRPAQAARAFARSRALSERGPLAEDALAREVEAWSRAGDARRARDRATRYRERYPDGHRIKAVERFGGL